jgi:hypothetical protein
MGLMTRELLLFYSYGLDLWAALSEGRMALSLVYAADPRQFGSEFFGALLMPKYFSPQN